MNYISCNTVRAIKLRQIRRPLYVEWIGELRKAYRILVGNLKERDCFGDIDIGMRLALMWILDKQVRNTDVIQLPQNRDRWRAPVNTVMNLQVP
jgi:hypothetical protein